jgi:uncharacterized protein (DUF924 family)
MFATDARAVELTHKAIANACVNDAAMKAIHPIFPLLLLLPLEHSETLSNHDVMAAELEKGEFGDMEKKYAKDHRDVIVRFGRYPHRNEIMGREHTPEEAEFLKTHKGW